MTIRINRLLKDDLSRVGSIYVSGLSNTSGMTISHFAYSPRQTEATIPYEVEIISEYVSKNIEIDFCLAIRTKIDLSATGINEEIIEDIGQDVGEYNYVNSAPSNLLQLPPGFTEFYKG